MSFNKELFEKAIEQFDVNAAKERLAELNVKREEFVNHFTPDHIAKMSIDEYVIGWGKTDKPNFSYDLEWTLSGLGSFRGGSSMKFGVWYSSKEKAYSHAKRYSSPEVAFEQVRANILSLLTAGENKDIQEIIKNQLSLTFKGKILSTYYPDKYINIFTDEHLDHFLDSFNVDGEGKSVEEKRMLLAQVRADYEEMKDWSLQVFSKFLYEGYPKKKEDSNDSDIDPRLKRYQNFIIKCTRNKNSVRNYSDFKRINECLQDLYSNENLTILDIDTPEEFVEIKTQLENYDKFKGYDIDGRRQYSNALTHYLYYLQAKELFSELEDEMTIETSLPSTQDKYTNYLRALRTKPFMLLAGISGTGKSRLVRELAFKSCPNIDDLQADKTTPGNYLMIEIKPNWHDSTEILGYYSNISKKYQFTKFIHFLVKAKKYPKVPFFVCLDEMNLAPVEQYFAEFLSVIETRKKNDNAIVTGTLVEAQRMRELEGWTEGDLTLPDNVFIIGTVNMDDTTHQFSRKVIDRAMTIEMNGDKLANMFGRSGDLCYMDKDVWPLKQFKATHVCADEVLKELKQDQADTLKQGLVNKLDAINSCLKNTPFQVSYRVLNEMCIYAGVLLSEGLTIDMAIAQAVDQITLMKILPRIEGDEDLFVVDKQNKNRLEMLIELFDENSESYKKLEEMNNRLESGFTRFWP